MMAFLYVLQPDVFLTPRNLTNILQQIAMNALLSLGMFLVILTAGIDLSVGSVLALSMMSLAIADAAGWPWPVVILIGPMVGLCCGMVNGAGLTLLRLPHPFIMTLGTLNVARGLTNLDLRRPADLRARGAREIPRLGADPDSVSWGRSARSRSSAIVLARLLRRHGALPEQDAVGRHIYAVGGNPQAARVSGINVDRILLWSTRCRASSPGLLRCSWRAARIRAFPMPASAPSSTRSPPSSSAARASSAAAARCSASSPAC